MLLHREEQTMGNKRIFKYVCAALFCSLLYSCMYSTDAPATDPSAALASADEITFSIPQEGMVLIDSTPVPRSFKDYRIDVQAALRTNGQDIPLSGAQFKLHGESSLDFSKKSLKVFTDHKVLLPGMKRASNEFLLVSMVVDKGYINNFIAYTTLARAGLFTSDFRFIKVSINNRYQGLYLLVEDVKESISASVNSVPFIFRRNYGPSFETTYASPLLGVEELTRQRARLEALYPLLDQLHGRALLDSLTALIDLKQYCQWLGVNYLLRNGDYLDEIFFYAVPSRDHANQLLFKVHGWDYDDLFLPPHGGFSFEGKLIYCQEDALDRTIGNDSILYQWYRSRLEELVNTTLSEDLFEGIQHRLRTELLPFFLEDSTAAVMNNFSSSPNSAYHELETLITARFSEIGARLDSIRTVLKH
jgi:spore coat protein H